MKNWEFNLNRTRNELPEPVGYSRVLPTEEQAEKKNQQDRELLERKLWQFSVSGASQILMAFFMFWMMGGGLHIFSVIFTFSFIMQPVRSLMNINATYKQFEGKRISLFYYKAVYASIQLAILSIGMYKLYGMGLLPLSSSDWIDLLPAYSVKLIFK